jgi:hypothetical protein
MLLPLLLAVAAGAGLQQDIERTIAEAGFTNREVSVAVRECGTDRLIAAVSASSLACLRATRNCPPLASPPWCSVPTFHCKRGSSVEAMTSS